MPRLMTTAGTFISTAKNTAKGTAASHLQMQRTDTPKKGVDPSSPSSSPSPSPSSLLCRTSSSVYLAGGGSKSSKKSLVRLPFLPSPSSIIIRETGQYRKDLTARPFTDDPLFTIDPPKTHLYSHSNAVALHPCAAKSGNSMVHSFIQKEDPTSLAAEDDAYAFTSSQDSTTSSAGDAEDMLQVLVTPSSEAERRLTQEVSKILDAIDMNSSFVYENGKASYKSRSEYLRKVVVKQLQFSGYNAAFCRSKWDQSAGIQAGDYEYIDTVLEQPNGKVERLIVELEWKEHFETARPSNHYGALLHLLPSLLVGTLDKVLTLVDILTKAATKSLKKEGLDLPPWRRSNYMRAKWSSPYNRITTHYCQISSYSKNVKFPKDVSSLGSAFQGYELEANNNFHDWELIYDEAKLPWPKKVYGVPYEDVLLHNKGLGSNMREGADRLSVFVNTDWELPPVNPRLRHKPPEVAGLATVLMRS